MEGPPESREGYNITIVGLASGYVDGSRAIYALAHSGMLPAFLGKLHPTHKTPTNAIFLMGICYCIAPFLGRPALVWLVVAGGLGIVSDTAFRAGYGIQVFI